MLLAPLVYSVPLIGSNMTNFFCPQALLTACSFSLKPPFLCSSYYGLLVISRVLVEKCYLHKRLSMTSLALIHIRTEVPSLSLRRTDHNLKSVIYIFTCLIPSWSTGLEALARQTTGLSYLLMCEPYTQHVLDTEKVLGRHYGRAECVRE